MKYKIIFSFLLVFVFVFFSCKKTDNAGNSVKYEKTVKLKPKIDLEVLQSKFINWWSYYNEHINLNSDFVPLNEKSEIIDKKQFLVSLTSGQFIPLKTSSSEIKNTYRLYKLNNDANNSIKRTISSESQTQLKHFKMEGLSFPEFEFTDLKQEQYTNENTKNKTIIFKTWFVNCKACIEEFPELNEFVSKYEGDQDILFISLAIDSNEALSKFLKKKAFKYQVIPNQEDFIENKLQLQIYPTHIIVENGIIIKVTNKASDMIEFFESENI